MTKLEPLLIEYGCRAMLAGVQNLWGQYGSSLPHTILVKLRYHSVRTLSPVCLRMRMRVFRPPAFGQEPELGGKPQYVASSLMLEASLANT